MTLTVDPTTATPVPVQGGRVPDEPVGRYLHASLIAGAPAATTVRLHLRGTVRVGRWWLPFRAVEVVSSGGFVRVAHVAGVARVTDTLLPDESVRRVRIAARIVTEDDGPDPERRGVAHLALAGLWCPATALVDPGRVSAPDHDHVRLAGPGAGPDRPDTVLELHRHGLPQAVTTEAWGDPTGGHRPDWFPYGGPVFEHRTWEGTTVPSTGVLGWFPDGDGFVPVVRWQLTSWEALDDRRAAP